MKKIIRLLSLLFVILIFTSGKHQTTIFIIGDSTAAEKPHPATNPERGWGMVFQGCFTEDILVDNHAVNGESTKSFIDEGKWQKVLDEIKPGDYVFIEFGHNDEKSKDPRRYTQVGSTFDANLRSFVKETRECKGIPVLFNCVVRRCFWSAKPDFVDDEKLRNTVYDGNETITSDTLIDTHGAYKDVPEKIAREMNVPFINANKITHDIEQGMGVIGSRKLHMWFLPGENKFVPKGKKDNTHYNYNGAHIVANALADAVGRQIPALKKYVRHYDYVVSARGRGNFMNLQEAVNAVPAGGKVQILILDGTWNKPVVPIGKKIKFVMYSSVKIVK
jgi:pectinesterase